MSPEELARSLDLLIKEVEEMPQTPTIAKALQGLKHAQYQLIGE